MHCGRWTPAGPGLYSCCQGGRAVNHLRGEKSPYLLQHAGNPVDWYPWGEEAFDRARHEDKPIFLSIGYSTCHWCHVMERESFEDPEVAGLMNAALRVHQGRPRGAAGPRPALHGGQPDAHAAAAAGRSPIVMTPEAKPFFAAHLHPAREPFGRAGHARARAADRASLWKNRRDRGALPRRLDRRGDRAGRGCAPQRGGRFDRGLARARRPRPLASHFDAEHGGFGSAPKFPMATVYPFLLRSWKRTGDAAPARHGREDASPPCATAAIYDQLGFGFHRYSTDREWLVPHFEKMLYDQALLAMAYTEASRRRAKDFYPAHGRRDLHLRAARPALARGRVSTPPRTPTARARRAGSTSGAQRRSWTHSVPTPSRRSSRTYGIRETGSRTSCTGILTTSAAPGSAEGRAPRCEEQSHPSFPR